MVTFTPLQKEGKKGKQEETKLISRSLYIRNALCDLVEIWNVGY